MGKTAILPCRTREICLSLWWITCVKSVDFHGRGMGKTRGCLPPSVSNGTKPGKKGKNGKHPALFHRFFLVEKGETKKNVGKTDKFSTDVAQWFFGFPFPCSAKENPLFARALPPDKPRVLHRFSTGVENYGENPGRRATNISEAL